MTFNAETAAHFAAAMNEAPARNHARFIQAQDGLYGAICSANGFYKPNGRRVARFSTAAKAWRAAV